MMKNHTQPWTAGVVMSELKPCPFCGGKADHTWTMLSHDADGLAHYVKCTQCPVGVGDYATADEAADAWNRRPGERTLRRLRDVEAESYRFGMLLLSEIVVGLAAKSELGGVLCSVCRHNTDSHGMNCLECCPVKDAERRVAANYKPEPGTVPELCTECGGNIADDECQCAEAK